MTSSSRPRLRASSLAALASVPLLVLGLAACSPSGSDSGASPSTGAKSDSQVESDALAWDVANAQCMRGEGIDVPDPSSDGSKQALTFDGSEYDAFERASKKCQEEVQGDLGPRPVTASEKKARQESIDEQLRTNECLREKGFDVPDPDASGGGSSGGYVDVPEETLAACGMAGGGGGAAVPE